MLKWSVKRVKGYEEGKRVAHCRTDLIVAGSRWDTGYRRGCMNANTSVSPDGVARRQSLVSTMFWLSDWILKGRVGKPMSVLGWSKRRSLIRRLANTGDTFELLPEPLDLTSTVLYRSGLSHSQNSQHSIKKDVFSSRTFLFQCKVRLYHILKTCLVQWDRS